MLLSMILMHQLTRVPTNDEGFLLYPTPIGVLMEVNKVIKKKIKQLSLLWKIIVMHHLIRPPIKKHAFLLKMIIMGSLYLKE